MGQSATSTDRPAARRRVCKVFVLTLIVLSLALALPAGASAATGWFKQSSGTTAEFDAVAFPDASHGWAIGNASGTVFIFATVNGGTNWIQQDSGTDLTLNSVAASDDTHAWAVGSTVNSWGGDDLAIFATTDGSTWAAQILPGTTGELNAVTFLPDGLHGWAVGMGGAIVATTDGGANWGLQTSGSTEDLYAVSFSSASNGWAVGNFGTILATANGGLSWSAQRSGSSAYLTGVDFVDANHGWAVGYNYGVFPFVIAEASEILATTNGGATWIPQNWASGSWLYDVAFSDASHGWAVGNDQGGDGGGPILVTRNGGATWTRQAVAATSLYGLASSDANHAWAVGKAGVIMATTDGGGALPGLTKLTPTAGKRGTTVVISGRGFGAKRSTSAVRFGATKCTQYVSWSTTRIKCKVPAKAKYGRVSVTVTTIVGKSNAKTFTVRR